LLRDLKPRLDLDKSDGRFAPVAIRNPDDRSSHDGGVCTENVLDLAGIDILAAADDQFLASGSNAAISALVEAPQIAGVKPAFGIRLPIASLRDCRNSLS
jgi:hypothetical protein